MSNNLNVRVTGPVVASENNPEYGYIRVEQDRMLIDELTGFLRVKTISALIPGSIKDLKKVGWVDGQTIGGKIVIREQLSPFYEGDPDKHLKVAGETGVICKVGESPIYRTTVYSSNLGAQDVLLAHTNGAEIKAAQAKLAEADLEL